MPVVRCLRTGCIFSEKQTLAKKGQFFLVKKSLPTTSQQITITSVQWYGYRHSPEHPGAWELPHTGARAKDTPTPASCNAAQGYITIKDLISMESCPI